MRRHSKIVWFYGLEGIDLTHQKAQQFHAVLCTEHAVPIAVGCCFLGIRSQHNASADCLIQEHSVRQINGAIQVHITHCADICCLFGRFCCLGGIFRRSTVRIIRHFSQHIICCGISLHIIERPIGIDQ